MSTQIQYRRGTTAQHQSFVGAAGEITIDTTLNSIRVHDGSTTGGVLISRASDTVASFNHANSAYSHANASFTEANSAYDKANSAYDHANTKFASAGGTISGDVNITGNLTVTGYQVYANTTVSLIADNIITLNAAISQSDAPTANAGIEIDRGSSANVQLVWNEVTDKWTFTNDGTVYDDIAAAGRLDSAYGHANSAYDKANSGYTQANTGTTHASAAFLQANTGTTHASAAYTHANSGYTQANTALAEADAAFTHANSSYDHANSAYDKANSGYTQANTALAEADSAYAHANASFTHANSAYNKANSAYDHANTKFASAGGTISGDVNITGNLSVTGNVTRYSSNELIVNDPIVLYANNNTGNILDIGFVAHYVESATTKHTGLIKDVSGNKWYLFENYGPHIQETNLLDVSEATLAKSNLVANLTDGTVSNLSSAVAVSDGGTGARTFTAGRILIGNGTGALQPLANTGTAGTYASASQVPVITTDGYGRVSGITNTAIAITSGQVSGLAASATTDTTSATNITTGTLAAARLATSGVTAGTYASASIIPVITVDAAGRVTAVTNTSVSIASGAVSGLAASATTDTTNASNIGSGTLPTGRLSGSYTGITGVGTLAAGSIPSGLITGLATSATTDATNASNIGSGTLPTGRLSGSYTGITGVGTLAAGSIPSGLITGLAASATTDATNASNIGSGTLAAARLATSGVTAGSYTVSSITVDSFGRVTAASNGTAAGTSVSNDTTTNSDAYYPSMTFNQTSGSVTTTYVSSTKLYYNPSTGQLNATNFNSLSDKNLKKNIITLENAVEKVSKLRGVSFDWKETNAHAIGVIAQEVEQVLPEVVSTNKDGEKSVNYGNIVGLLIEAIKEQQQQIDQLKSKAN